MRRLLKKFINSLVKLNRYLCYPSWIGFSNGGIIILYEFLGIRKIKSVKIANENLFIRTSTLDLFIAANCLLGGEYNNIKSLNPSVIIDAGAHIGTSSIYFARTYPNATILAIEPDEENYNMLLRNIENYKTITPINAALWNEISTKPLQDRLTGNWGYTIVNSHNQAVNTRANIECTTIPSLMKDFNLKSIDILKMDIEGAEKRVLEASNTWIDKVDIISVELHDRIVMGCTRAFYLATKSFKNFEAMGEKVTAYRNS